jgi:hypothetical protein
MHLFDKGAEVADKLRRKTAPLESASDLIVTGRG